MFNDREITSNIMLDYGGHKNSQGMTRVNILQNSFIALTNERVGYYKIQNIKTKIPIKQTKLPSS